jgi:hypothetical protein
MFFFLASNLGHLSASCGYVSLAPRRWGRARATKGGGVSCHYGAAVRPLSFLRESAGDDHRRGQVQTVRGRVRGAAEGGNGRTLLP